MFTLIGDENERKIRFRVRFLSVKITLKIGTFVRPGFSAGDLCDAVHGTVTYDGPEDDNWDQQVPSNECCADVRVNVSAPFTLSSNVNVIGRSTLGTPPIPFPHSRSNFISCSFR